MLLRRPEAEECDLNFIKATRREPVADGQLQLSSRCGTDHTWPPANFYSEFTWESPNYRSSSLETPQPPTPSRSTLYSLPNDIRTVFNNFPSGTKPKSRILMCSVSYTHTALLADDMWSIYPPLPRTNQWCPGVTCRVGHEACLVCNVCRIGRLKVSASGTLPTWTLAKYCQKVLDGGIPTQS
ncbi:hypothetical protein CEXT_703981 [Caerostris extrusa]|uniref:Uncharacterized protein n=1 Tax=Caerostris extrusa TaxID=172846 RepID=A0AAV4VIP3_CAEEX|nr:hypothetical protein CEXT_703981 [Caerostris extrusa]